MAHSMEFDTKDLRASQVRDGNTFQVHSGKRLLSNTADQIAVGTIYIDFL
jgi:hypothetical protein